MSKIIKLYTIAIAVILGSLVVYFFLNASPQIKSETPPCAGQSVDEYLTKLPPVSTSQKTEINSIHFYILGSIKCPHCRNALKFFSSHYPSSVSFRDITTDSSAMRAYKRLYLSTGITGIPVIGVASGKRLFAIVEGYREITPDIAKKIEQVALKDSTIIVFADSVLGIPISSGKADTLTAIFIGNAF